MGVLVDGKWKKGAIITSDSSGAFQRKESVFRDQISGDGIYKPEKERYHLYVSYACPWAHRTLILRKLKNLEDLISVSVVHPDLLENGWSFESDYPGSTGDELYGLKYLYEVYQKSDPQVSTKVTVPVLWDKKEKKIVNNESSEILRIFNTAFNDLTRNRDDYYPQELREEIDELNKSIYDNLNNGVYKAGFAKSQEAYDKAVKNIFKELDKLETLLEGREFLLGSRMTEADVRLITTLLRFDPVYFIHFKCSYRRIEDYKNLHRYLQNLYALPAVRDTTNFDHIVRHYYYSHEEINPQRIVPYLHFMEKK